MRQRVKERIEALKTNPFEVARIAGMERSFINDLLIGKKKRIRDDAVPVIAKALDCDPEYLFGVQSTPRADGKAIVSHEDGLPFLGACELGVFRDPSIPLPMARMPAQPDPRYDARAQVTFSARDDHADLLGISAGMVVVALSLDELPADHGPIRGGDVVIVRRTRPNGEFELSIRAVEASMNGMELAVSSSKFSAPSLPFPSKEGSRKERVEVLGLALRAVRVFGQPA